MISNSTFIKMAMALPEVAEVIHFEKPSFRIRNKIFASLHIPEKKAMIKLSLSAQAVYSTIDRTIIYPVPGAWGKKGFTFVELSKVKKSILLEALLAAWVITAPKTLAKKYFPDNLPVC